MSTIDRAVSPIDDSFLTQPEPREVQPDGYERSKVTSTMPSTEIPTSTDDSLSNGRHNEEDSDDTPAGLVEPGETHAFLPSKTPAPNFIEPEQTGGKYSCSALLMTWWFEIASLMVAIAALVAIVVMMAEYDKKEQPAWKFTINLNTLIAILSTLLRACMVVVLEEGISQLKWILFRHPKPLQHLAHFDSAARGPWGSLLLLFRTKTLDPALLGCIVVVLSVAIGPFTQQAVKAVPCNLPLESAEASIRISRWMHGFNLARLSPPHHDLDMNTKIAILDGLVNSNTTRYSIAPTCISGNCSFPSYNNVTHSSIGICSKCVNITPWVTEVHNTSRNITANGGYQFYGGDYLVLPDNTGVGGSSIISVSGVGIAPDPDHIYRPFEDSLTDAFDETFKTVSKTSIFNVSVVSLTLDGCEWATGDGYRTSNCSHRGLSFSSLWDNLNVVATACTFYPCVKNYHGSMIDNKFTENTVNEITVERPPSVLFSDYKHFNTPCIIDGQIYTLDNISFVPKENRNFTTILVDKENVTVPNQCIYGIGGTYALSVGGFLNQALTGNCASFAMGSHSTAKDWSTLNCQPWYIKNLVNNGNASFKTIDANMQSIANSITSEMRKQGSDLDNINIFLTRTDWDNPSPMGPTLATGTAFRTTVCTQFDWKWLSFPLVLIALTTLLLCVVCGKMLFSRQKIPAWKSSILPLLFTGNRIGTTVVAAEMKDIKADTSKIVVTLTHSGRGWEFVSEGYEDTKAKAA